MYGSSLSQRDWGIHKTWAIWNNKGDLCTRQCRSSLWSVVLIIALVLSGTTVHSIHAHTIFIYLYIYCYQYPNRNICVYIDTGFWCSWYSRMEKDIRDVHAMIEPLLFIHPSHWVVGVWERESRNLAAAFHFEQCVISAVLIYFCAS